MPLYESAVAQFGSYQRGSKIVEHPNLQCIFDGDILLFYASLESIVLGTVFWHVFTRGIREFVNGSDGCPPDCGILKSVSLLQPFPKIVSGPICLDGLEFLLNVTKPHGTNASFGPYFVLGPGCDFVFALFLAFEFSIIVEILVFEDDCDWSGVFLV